MASKSTANGAATARRTAPERAIPCAGVERNARQRTPKLGLHKTSGQARVVLNGREHYLGVFGTADAHERYAELLRRWHANECKPERELPTAPQSVLTIRTLFDRFLAQCDATGRYWKNGEPGTHRQRFEWVRESLATALNNAPVAKLSEAALIEWRDVLERDRGRTRLGINKLVALALLVLRWGKARKLVPKAVFADCAGIEPLQRGEVGDRPEHGRPRRAVSAEEAERVAACASPQVAAMIRLQALCGMRPGEVCGMRWADIDKTPIAGDKTGSWLCTVPAGKTSHHGHVTRYVLPPVAQKILEQFPATPLAFVFAPATAMAERRERLRANRKTPPTKQTAQRDANAPRAYGERWGINEYRRAVERACKAAKVARFTPHELRHGFATWAANSLSLGAAAAACNHRSVGTTQRYVHVRHDDALAVAAAVEARMRG